MADFQFRCDTVYEYLKNEIINSQLDDDQFYYGAKIAKDLGISRTPVRDALQRLSQDGLIEVVPSLGFRIRRLDKKDVQEIVELRCAIEGYSASVLCKNCSAGMPVEKTRSAMAGYMAQMEQLKLQPEDICEFARLDNQFHTELVSYMDNSLFNLYYDKNLFLIKRYLLSAMRKPRRMENSIVEHRAIFDCIFNGNVDKLLPLITEHIHAGAAELPIEEPVSTLKNSR